MGRRDEIASLREEVEFERGNADIAHHHAGIWKARAEEAEAALARILQIHRRNPLADLPNDDPNRTYYNADEACMECGEDWPCPTVKVAPLLHGPDCADCAAGKTEWHRSRSAKRIEVVMPTNGEE